MIKQVLVYRCSLCGRDHDTPQQHCSCENKLNNGDILGPFTILEKRNSGYQIECNICGMVKVIHYTNVRRQMSCGCKPRHVEITRILPTEIRYQCKKCQDFHTEPLPLDEWCCDD